MNDERNEKLIEEYRKINAEKIISACRNAAMSDIDDCLKKGGDINERDPASKNRTLLHSAVIRAQLQVISGLLTRKADITLQDEDNKTAYDLITVATCTEDLKNRMRQVFFDDMPEAPAGSLNKAAVTQEFNDNSEAATTTRPVRVVAKINLKPNDPVL